MKESGGFKNVLAYPPQQRRRIDFIERSCAAGDPNFDPERAHIFLTVAATSGDSQAVSPWSRAVSGSPDISV